MVSGALQSLAGHDPGSISSEKAVCTDRQNRVGIEKTGRKRNKHGEGQKERYPGSVGHVMGQSMILVR